MTSLRKQAEAEKDSDKKATLLNEANKYKYLKCIISTNLFGIMRTHLILEERKKK
jgi:hypothetical protein